MDDSTQPARIGDRWPPSLSRAEYEAGVPCPGCGLPYTDGLGDWPPVFKRTPEQQAEYEQADALFRARHPDCGGGYHRHVVSGSRTWHCLDCCPPPPLSDRQAERTSAILFGSKAG
jgi:hypothetical protein